MLWLISRPDMSKNLIRHMYDILAVLIEEAQSIPAGVMDVIIKQFELQKDKDVSRRQSPISVGPDRANHADKKRYGFPAHPERVQPDSSKASPSYIRRKHSPLYKAMVSLN